jgi:DNA-binding transcriptional ArsR family regulator
MGDMGRINCMAVLKALSELSRMRILRLLLKERLDVNEISRRLKMSQYNVSKHLRVLREAGLLEVEKRGKYHLYGMAASLKRRLASNKRVLALKCCTFRFDQLPK